MASTNRNSGKIVVLDGGSREPGMDEYLKYIDYAICSYDFYPPVSKIREKVIGFLLVKGIRNIAITRGERSVIAANDEIETEIPVRSVKALDTLGAGDVFHGAFCYYL
jgi:sugar/nucleoside kinase (ribokinase family)